MAKAPNRYPAIAGAMAAAQRAGDPARARSLASELLKLGTEADTQRPSLQEARRITSG